MQTVQCPGCQQTLPAWTQVCQFCGYQLTHGYARHIDLQDHRRRNMPTWKEAGYVVVSVLLLLLGVLELLQSFDVIPNLYTKWGGSAFIGVWGVVHCTLALGMLFHQTWAQFLVKYSCMLSLLLTSFNLLLQLMMPVRSSNAAIAIAANLFNIVLYAMTIYLINEEGDV